jgi:hypothetical protein
MADLVSYTFIVPERRRSILSSFVETNLQLSLALLFTGHPPPRTKSTVSRLNGKQYDLFGNGRRVLFWKDQSVRRLVGLGFFKLGRHCAL